MQQRAADMGTSNTLIRQLAALGARGSQRTHMERDLWRLIERRRLALAVDPYEVKVQVSKPRQAGVATWVSMPVLLPHEMFAAIAELQFEQSFLTRGGASQQVSAWWRAVANQEWVRFHPVPPADRQRCLPVGLYGDDAPVNKVESVTIICWNSILGDRSSWQNRFLICAIPKRFRLKGVTLAPIWRVVAWSLQVMTSGCWPQTDWQGRPWPAGSSRANRAGTPLVERGRWRASLVEVRCDWPFQRDEFFVPSWNSIKICYRCAAAHEGDTPWNDFREQAAWCNMPLSQADYMHTCGADRTKNAVVGMPGFHVDFLKMDAMHSVHLGYGQVVNANALLEAIEMNFFGPAATAYHASWADFKEWCRRNKIHTSQPMWSAKSFQAEGLTGPEMGTKAFNSRLITAWLREVWHSIILQDLNDDTCMRCACGRVL